MVRVTVVCIGPVIFDTARVTGIPVSDSPLTLAMMSSAWMPAR
jgi:hypothetical protein